jgi:hypothetical protein
VAELLIFDSPPHHLLVYKWNSLPASLASHDIASSAARVDVSPNPATREVVIALNCPAQSWVEIAAYDIAGRKVDTILAQNMEPGQFVQTWNPANLATGIYFVHAEGNTFAATSRAILIR